MKLPSYLVRSRHGIFYFRITFIIEFIRREKRWSLHTKNPVEAKRLSLIICATLGDNSMVKSIMSRVGLPQGYAGLIANEHPGGSIKMAIDNKFLAGLITTIQSRNGSTMKLEVDQSDPADVAAAKELAETFLREDTKNADSANWDFLEEINAKKMGIVQDVIEVNTDKVRKSIEELIDGYQLRKKDSLSPKSKYEYYRMQRKFAAWLKSEKNNGETSFYRVGRPEISGFIDALQRDGRSLQTIQKKYLAALNGLFEFAQTAGDYPKGDLPTKNHKIYTRRDQKRTKSKSGWKPFSDDDLSLIFNPENLLAREKPCDYWLPFLGLYTGGRISELCQLKPDNIRQIEGIWAIDINDEGDDQSVKTPASIRIIPIHSQLIDLGFLDYVEEVRQYNGTIFPYMTLDRFNHYSKTPSKRFGEYLDRLHISDSKKVFHSFRSTSNDRLKQNRVQLEDRCQFIGHEFNIVNSKDYSLAFRLKYMRDNVAIHLTFDHLDFSRLHYPSEKMNKKLDHLMKKVIRDREHKKAVALRQA